MERTGKMKLESVEMKVAQAKMAQLLVAKEARSRTKRTLGEDGGGGGNDPVDDVDECVGISGTGGNVVRAPGGGGNVRGRAERLAEG